MDIAKMNVMAGATMLEAPFLLSEGLRTPATQICFKNNNKKC